MDSAVGGTIHISHAKSLYPSTYYKCLHDGVSNASLHTLPLSCRAFHSCTTEDDLVIAKTKMSYRDVVGLR